MQKILKPSWYPWLNFFLSFVHSFFQLFKTHWAVVYILLHHLLGGIEEERYIALHLDKHLYWLYVQGAVGVH